MEICPLVEQEIKIVDPIQAFDLVLYGIDHGVQAVSLDSKRGRLYLEVAVTPELVADRFHLKEPEVLYLVYKADSLPQATVARIRPTAPLRVTDMTVCAGRGCLTAFYEAPAEIELA